MRSLTGLLLLIVAGLAEALVPVTVDFEASTPYQSGTVMLRGELYRPEGKGPHPAVLLMHGCGGLTTVVRAGLKLHADNFVRHGFVVLTLDSFGPRGISGGWVCAGLDRLSAARRYRTTDALDAIDYLQSLGDVDARNVFQLGQSNGASVSIRLAQLRDRRFRAIAAYYPWCGAFVKSGGIARLASPLIVLAAAQDDWTHPADCVSMQSSTLEYKVVLYPNAHHSFDLPVAVHRFQGHTVGHDAEAAVDSRGQVVRFFLYHLTEDRKRSMPTVSVENSS